MSGILTETFEIRRGVKQGCPLSASLYILAINPILKKIKEDVRLCGTRTSSGERMAVLTYDDVTVIIKNVKELDIVNENLLLYDMVSGAKLNHNKTEGVWFGKENKQPNLNIKMKDKMRILGINFRNKDSYDKN